MVDQLAAVVAGVGLFVEQLDAFGQVVDDDQPFGFIFVSGVEGLAEEVTDLAERAPSPVGQALDQLLTAVG